MIDYRWIQKQDTKELWLDGIDDYVEYAKQLSTEFEDVVKQQDDTANGGGGSGVAVATTTTATTTTTAPASSGFFNFSAPPSKDLNSGAGFGQPTDAKANTGGEDETEQEQDEEAIELEMDTTKADVLFTKKLHLLTQDPETKKWKDKGTGIFSLRKSKPTEASAKPVSYIVFTAASGRVLINAPVVKGLKPMVNPKSPANVIMFLISKEEDGTEKKEMHLFKCGSEDAANEVVSHVAEQA